MSIEFKCPSCGAEIFAEDEEAGYTVDCLGCGSQLRVPANNSDPSTIAKLGRVRPDQIPVSTTDITGPHQIISPISFVVGSRGEMGEEFELLKSHQSYVISQAKRLGQLSRAAGLGQSITSVGLYDDGSISANVQHSGSSFVSTDLEIAFMIAVSQMQFRASCLGANAVYGFKWDVDVDSNAGVINFIGTAYGTAVIIQ